MKDDNLLLCKTVMLPADKETNLWRAPTNGAVFTENLGDTKPQFLHFTSDREIKEGDWCVWNCNIYKSEKDDESPFFQLINLEGKYLPSLKSPKDCKKIEASTDPSLWESSVWLRNTNRNVPTKDDLCKVKGVPQIPKSFIQDFVKVNGDINEVMVEFDMVNRGSLTSISDLKVKTRPDNTVITHQ